MAWVFDDKLRWGIFASEPVSAKGQKPPKEGVGLWCLHE